MQSGFFLRAVNLNVIPVCVNKRRKFMVPYDSMYLAILKESSEKKRGLRKHRLLFYLDVRFVSTYLKGKAKKGPGIK